MSENIFGRPGWARVMLITAYILGPLGMFVISGGMVLPAILMWITSIVLIVGATVWESYLDGEL